MEMHIDSIIFPLPTDQLLEREEKMWRVRLPNDYKVFLKQYNGGIPEKKSFSTNNHSYALDRFLCILNDTESNKLGIYDIDVTLTRIEEKLTDNENLIGVDLLPIAILFAGDYVCLDFRKSKEKPSVCAWDHEESAELEPITNQTSKNFVDFLNMLS